MSKKKIVVPEGMLTSACEYYQRTSEGYPRMDMVTLVRGTLEAAMRWLSENPIVPTDEQIRDLFEANHYGVSREAWRIYFTEWQRRMFLAPEPEIPDQIKDLIFAPALTEDAKVSYRDHDAHVLEAFRRGQKEGPR